MSIEQAGYAIVEYDVFCYQLLEITVTRDDHMLVIWMQLYPTGDHVISFAVWMAQHRAVGLGLDEFDEPIHALKENLIFFNFSLSALRGCYLAVGLVWCIHILAPAATFQTKHRMATAKISPYLLDAVEYLSLIHI